jgi:hypothetical protein
MHVSTLSTGSHKSAPVGRPVSTGECGCPMSEASSPTNLSETEQMCAVLTEWGRSRWRGCRVIRELVLGERRVDLAFVCERDVIGLEVKGPRDTLRRLKDQMNEYGRYFPEVWVAVAPRWKEAEELHWSYNVLVVDNGMVSSDPRRTKPVRDELVVSRMLELLWTSEAQAIAQRTGVIPGVPTQQMARKAKPMLARLLTGNEILKNVCQELRARQLVGLGSDGPMR